MVSWFLTFNRALIKKKKRLEWFTLKALQIFANSHVYAATEVLDCSCAHRIPALVNYQLFDDVVNERNIVICQRGTDCQSGRLKQIIDLFYH